MGIVIDLFYLIIGLGLLYFGAEWLVGGAGKIAVKYGISPLVVGLTIVAFGTSAPELFVSIGFNLGGFPDMAVGNVVGSNICNIGLVLGFSAFICALHVNAALLWRDLPIMVVVTLILAAMVYFGHAVSRIEGIILFLGVIAYTIYQLYLARRVKDPQVLAEFESEFGQDKAAADPVWKLAGMVLIGLVLLFFGADFLEKGGVSLAKKFGVPEAVISLTLIAFSTSVPELATSIVASLKKEGDIIIGNVIGSCIFNILCVIGLTAGIKPIEISQIETSDLVVMVAFAIILVPIMLSKRIVGRFEGAFLLAAYLGYCVFLWFDRVAVS